MIALALQTIGTDTVQTVNAVELHTFLQVKSEYYHWFTRRVKTYGFVQGVDYADVTFDGVGLFKTTEHHVSLDMAKELAMVERTPKGKEARAYFIACEKKALAQEVSQGQLAQLALQIEALRRDIAGLKSAPKASQRPRACLTCGKTISDAQWEFEVLRKAHLCSPCHSDSQRASDRALFRDI